MMVMSQKLGKTNKISKIIKSLKTKSKFLEKDLNRLEQTLEEEKNERNNRSDKN